MFSRRKLLVTGGASIVLLGGGAVLFKTLHSDLAVARQPWSDAGQGFEDPRLEALSYAVLAPSPHNRQPWLVHLDGDNQLSLFCDLDRLLPETDPPNRQITIGLGAFLETLQQAAAENEYRVDIVPFPDGEPFPVLDERAVAHVAFVRDEAVVKDPLFAAVLDRRTVRDAFDQSRPVSPEILQEIGSAMLFADGGFSWTADERQMTDLKQVCQDGWLIEANTPHTHQESVRLMRIGDTEINQNPDGIALSGALIEALRVGGMISREQLKDPSTRAFQEGIEFYAKAIETAMAFGWLVTNGNTRKDQLATGADWMRMNLAATLKGIAMHPLSQVLQEYEEMTEAYKRVHELTGVSAPARIQGLFRFGYAKSPAPAARWPMVSRIIEET